MTCACNRNVVRVGYDSIALPPRPGEVSEIGHGTHAATTAVGSSVLGASVLGADDQVESVMHKSNTCRSMSKITCAELNYPSLVAPARSR